MKLQNVVTHCCAECLMWKGREYFQRKINEQLLPYASWRDDKLAAFVFSENKIFSDVISSMKGVLENHPQKVRSLPYGHESGCRYEFRRADDPRKTFILTAVAFNVT